jgi:uncharacterized SAM-binding protein YcdF (DUF218 family)
MGRFGAWRYIGLAALVFVIALFLILPAYLGPDDLARCGQMPDNNNPNPNCHQQDAIVAISGGDTQARAGEAITLYKNGWAPWLIFSGAAEDKTGPSNAAQMKKQAIAGGVPASAILTDDTSVDTEENATNTKVLLEAHHLQRIILVTSAYHQQRASLEFNKTTTNTSLYVVNHPVAHDKQWTNTWYFTPSGWWLAGGEIVKIISFYSNGN